MWERRRHGRRIDITVEAVEELSFRQRTRLEAEVDRVGAFFAAERPLRMDVLD